MRVCVMLAILLFASTASAWSDDGVNAMIDAIETAHQTRDLQLLARQLHEDIILIAENQEGAFVLDKQQTLTAMENQIWNAAELEKRALANRQIDVRNDLAFIRVSINDTFKNGSSVVSQTYLIARKTGSVWQVCFGMPLLHQAGREEGTLMPVGPAQFLGGDEPHAVKELFKLWINAVKTGESKSIRETLYPERFFSFRRESGDSARLITSRDAWQTIEKEIEESRNALDPSTLEVREIGVIATKNMALAAGMVHAKLRNGDTLEVPTRLEVYVRRGDSWLLVANLVDRFRLRGFPAEQSAQMNIQGKITGIGVELAKQGEDLLIKRVLPGTPAERAEIRDGEIIVSIDGKPAAGMSIQEAVSVILGEAGTQVALAVRNPSGNVRNLTIVRAAISIPGVESRMLDDQIGYLKISVFNMETPPAVRKALNDFRPQKAKGIILDLRGNTGGVYPEVVKVADILLPGDSPKLLWILRQQGKNPTNVEVSGRSVSDLPMVVLIDEKTSGGAELLAAALRNHSRATLAGMKTAGAAILKERKRTLDDGFQTVQTGDFLFPDGQTGKDGVTPDILQPKDATPEQILELGVGILNNTI